MRRLRQHLGAIAHDWPRFLRDVALTRRWRHFRNRNERISADAETGGVRCEWRFTSDLHLPALVPGTAALLLRRALESHPMRLAGGPLTSGAPELTFVIGHRGAERVPLLIATLASIAAQRDAAIECIVVEQSAEAEIGDVLPSWVRHIHTTVPADRPYNRSAAFNAGAAAARSGVLVFHDNDMLVPEDYAAAVLRQTRRGWEFVDLKRFIFYLDRSDTERIAAQPAIRDVRPVSVMQNARGGSVAASRDAYETIGGFDEEFVGWGGEDNDFWDRAETRRAWRFGTIPMIHLWHAGQPAKQVLDPSSGLARYHAIAGIAPAERIARIRARQNGSK